MVGPSTNDIEMGNIELREGGLIGIGYVDGPDKSPSQFCLSWECPEVPSVPDDGLGVAEWILLLKAE